MDGERPHRIESGGAAIRNLAARQMAVVTIYHLGNKARFAV